MITPAFIQSMWQKYTSTEQIWIGWHQILLDLADLDVISSSISIQSGLIYCFCSFFCNWSTLANFCYSSKQLSKVNWDVSTSWSLEMCQNTHSRESSGSVHVAAIRCVRTQSYSMWNTIRGVPIAIDATFQHRIAILLLFKRYTRCKQCDTVWMGRNGFEKKRIETSITKTKKIEKWNLIKNSLCSTYDIKEALLATKRLESNVHVY